MTPSIRKRVYIAGPISKGDLVHNVNQATEAFIALAKAGLAPLCPHWSVYSKKVDWMDSRQQTNDCRSPGACSGCRNCRVVEIVVCEATAMGNDQMTHMDWIGIDLPWVAASDAVLRLPGESVGGDLETAEAVIRGIPVFSNVDEIIAWAAR